MSVRQLPRSERPRERLARLGAEALSEPELFACVLGRGVAGESVLVVAHRLLAEFGSLDGLADASMDQLARLRGIGPAKAVALKATVELARRLALVAEEPRPAMTSTAAAAAVLRPHLVRKKREHVLALLLDQRHRLIRLSRIAVGSLSATVVHPRELFKEAIAASAAAVIVAHNHVSGDPEPSAEDLALTRRLADAGAVLGIQVLDHLIIASSGVVSLRAAGALDGQAPRGSRRVRRR